MRWAVFEFEDSSCEVGETAWIYGEDEEHFNNDDWLFSKEIIVKWPKDCAKWKRISSKTSVDIDEVETDRYPAKIVKFSDDNQTINEFIRRYVKTGDPKTPSRGRGQRVPVKNPVYEDESDVETSPEKNRAKKTKKENKGARGKKSLLNVLKRKYSISTEKTEELPDPKRTKLLTDEIEGLKEANKDLRKQVEQLHSVVSSLKDLPDIVKSLKETVYRVKSFDQKTPPLQTPSHLLKICTSSPARSPLAELPNNIRQQTSTEMASTPTEIKNPPEVHVSSPGLCPQRTTGNQDDAKIEIWPGIYVLPAQKKTLDVLGDAKSYLYSVMEMIWTRDVLATHSFTGKVSNAHKGKVAKPCLDQTKVTALFGLIKKKFPLVTEKEIKTNIKAKLNNVEKCHRLKIRNN